MKVYNYVNPLSRTRRCKFKEQSRPTLSFKAVVMASLLMWLEGCALVQAAGAVGLDASVYIVIGQDDPTPGCETTMTAMEFDGTNGIVIGGLTNSKSLTNGVSTTSSCLTLKNGVLAKYRNQDLIWERFFRSKASEVEITNVPWVMYADYPIYSSSKPS